MPWIIFLGFLSQHAEVVIPLVSGKDLLSIVPGMAAIFKLPECFAGFEMQHGQHFRACCPQR
jgi:hypothetical protein